ncbi:hypothetical protein NQ318_017608 [Aromia moschata]|uniref:DUF4817 domain-containing protein n=1 Tax=Aromia moschata TaxID=1265417 RepID=A0AAV8Z1C4_9CUCU|nr:hypothetical protein NQ318_017608 [Aromia moschata]
MIGYGDRARTQCEVVRLFRERHPDLPPLNQGTISKIEAQYREMGHVRKVPSKRQTVVDDDTNLNLLLALEENPIHVNRQNCRYWAEENPHWMRELHTQRPQKTNVWAGIIQDRIVGPFFFDDTLNGARYLSLLQQELMPVLCLLFTDALDELPLDYRYNLHLQLDGAPIHNAVIVRNSLNENFPDCWIGKCSPLIRWPPRSPDITPLDFFLWGTIKNKVMLQGPKAEKNFLIVLEKHVRV